MDEPLFPIRRSNTQPSPGILELQPYRLDDGIWVFDDPTVGLEREPFVGEVNRLLDELSAHIPNAAQGFRLSFSAQPFAGQQTTFRWLRADPVEGNWYRAEESGIEGWLCPSLFHYFGTAPAELHARADALTDGH